MNKGSFGHISAFIAVLLPLFTFSSFSLVGELLTPLEILIAGAAASVVILKFISPKHLRLPSLSYHLISVLSGVLLVALPFFFSYMALRFATVDTLVFMIACSPCLCAFVAYALRVYEKECAHTFSGAAFAVAGAFLLTVFREGTLSVSVMGTLYSFGAAFSVGAGLLCLRRLLGVGGSLGVIRRVLFWGTLVSLVFINVLDFDPKRYMSLIEPYMIVNLLFCAVAVPVICLSLFSCSVKQLGIMSSASYIYAFPAIAVVIYALMGNITVSATVLIGVVLSVISVALTSKRQ